MSKANKILLINKMLEHLDKDLIDYVYRYVEILYDKFGDDNEKI